MTRKIENKLNVNVVEDNKRKITKSECETELNKKVYAKINVFNENNEEFEEKQIEINECVLNKADEYLEEIHEKVAATKGDLQTIAKLMLGKNNFKIEDNKVFDEAGRWVADIKDIEEEEEEEKKINECGLYRIQDYNLGIIEEMSKASKMDVMETIDFLKLYHSSELNIKSFKDLEFNNAGDAYLAITKSEDINKYDYSIVVTKLDIQFKLLQEEFLNEEFGLLELDNKIQAFCSNRISSYDSNIEDIEEGIVEGKAEVELLYFDEYQNYIIIKVEILDDYENQDINFENVDKKIDVDKVSVKVLEMYYV